MDAKQFLTFALGFVKQGLDEEKAQYKSAGYTDEQADSILREIHGEIVDFAKEADR